MAGEGPVGAPAVAAARPVILLRVRHGLVVESARVVHLVPVSDRRAGVVTALCGALLRTTDCEAVNPGRGAPCDGCLCSHLVSEPAQSWSEAGDSGAGIRSAAMGYRGWGWPVLLRGDQVWLSLRPDAVALVMPSSLAAELAALLDRCRCPLAILAHPDLPEHRVLLAGQRTTPPEHYPPEVYRVTDAVPLPPSRTTHGAITWTHPPRPTSLIHCRDTDVSAALRALYEPPSNPIHF